MPLNDVLHLRRLKRHICAPDPEPALRVDALHPRIQCDALGAVLLGVFAFHFQHQHPAVGQAHAATERTSPKTSLARGLLKNYIQSS